MKAIFNINKKFSLGPKQRRSSGDNWERPFRRHCETSVFFIIRSFILF